MMKEMKTGDLHNFFSCEDWRVENNAKYEYPMERLGL